MVGSPSESSGAFARLFFGEVYELTDRLKGLKRAVFTVAFVDDRITGNLLTLRSKDPKHLDYIRRLGFG